MSTAETIQSRADVMQKAKANTLISPRFYKTDYAAMDKLDMSPVRAEWDAMLAEYEGDNNHDHFQRNEEFAKEVQQLPPELHQEFLDFLVSSITSEYSGCVLYNEIRKNVTNPDIKALMTYLTRDESRHAGFINQSLKDYNLAVDLPNLKSTKATRAPPGEALPPDLSLVRTLVQRRVSPWRILRADDACPAAPAARWQPAVDPLLPARGLRHHVRA
jgi:magnesium-protoporphyrin IX monomethyl ester (oxidative) cyclase